jgi:DNA-binding NtrC family response regulator
MSGIPKILIVDDEDDFLRSASLTLRMNGFADVKTCTSGNEALRLLASDDYSLVLLDIMMPDCDGRELLPKMTAVREDVPIIMSTAINEVEVAVSCMKAGAFDYLVKPIDKARLLATIGKALDFYELKSENQRLTDSFLKKNPGNPHVFKSIIAQSDSMTTLFRYIEAIAPTSMPVLITGETGTGKELFARSVHDASARTGNFVAVNVAGLDDTMFSDALFGHERGAFTGADKKREGIIVKASQGTLFLDEIGDLRIETQVKLLRLLEERTYFPVGSDTACQAHCRVVAATSVDLSMAVSEGKFRKDLYYRLKSHTVRVPALRQHKEDIPGLLKHFLAMAARELNKQPPTPPPQLHVLLQNYSFPGNVRELRGMVYDAVGRHTGGVLSMDSFKENLLEENSDSETTPQPLDGRLLQFGEKLPTLKEIEEILVTEALHRAGNNQSLAARFLGITPSALNKRLNKT